MASKHIHSIEAAIARQSADTEEGRLRRELSLIERHERNGSWTLHDVQRKQAIKRRLTEIEHAQELDHDNQ